ncbi:MAG: O-antigen ligase family protein, partial [Opitutaceae bacterium]
RERVAQLVSDGGERTRPFMWTGAWRLWLDAPVTGNGAGSYNLLFERHRAEGFRDEPLWAHNEYLNLLADYGLIGALLAGGAVMAIVAGCRRSLEASGSRAWPAAGIGLGLLAFALQMTFEFHLKIPGLALAVAAAAGLAVARVWPIKESESSHPASRWPWVLVGCLALAAWFLGERPRVAAEARRAPARAALDGLASRPTGDPDYARVLPKARDDLVVATRLHPGNAQSWADLSYATALTAFVSPERTADLGREAEAAADAAIRLCPLAGEYWARRGEARDLQGRWAEAGADFSRAVELSPADAVMWYRYGAHLARRPAGREAAEAALRFGLRLDPWFSESLRLLERLQRPSRP